VANQRLFTGFIRDISRLARAQGAEALLHYAALVESSTDDAIIGKTLDGYITSWNRGAENGLWLLAQGNDRRKHLYFHSSPQARMKSRASWKKSNAASPWTTAEPSGGRRAVIDISVTVADPAIPMEKIHQHQSCLCITSKRLERKSLRNQRPREQRHRPRSA